jgi:hypothetical protein
MDYKATDSVKEGCFAAAISARADHHTRAEAGEDVVVAAVLASLKGFETERMESIVKLVNLTAPKRPTCCGWIERRC